MPSTRNRLCAVAYGCSINSVAVGGVTPKSPTVWCRCDDAVACTPSVLQASGMASVHSPAARPHTMLRAPPTAVQEGLRFLVPFMRKRVCRVSEAAMREALAHDVGARLPLETMGPELLEAVTSVGAGPLALVCPCPADLVGGSVAGQHGADAVTASRRGVARYVVSVCARVRACMSTVRTLQSPVGGSRSLTRAASCAAQNRGSRRRVPPGSVQHAAASPQGGPGVAAVPGAPR